MTACAIAPLIYGAIPVFADVEIESGCLDPLSIESLITPRTKGFSLYINLVFRQIWMIMHLQKHKLFVIEDCAQAHGAKYKNQLVELLATLVSLV